MRNRWQRERDKGISRAWTCCQFFSVDFCRSYWIYNQLWIYECRLKQVLGLHLWYLFTLFSCSSTTWDVEGLEVHKLALAAVELFVFLFPFSSVKYSLRSIWFLKVFSEAQALLVLTARYAGMGFNTVLETNAQNHQGSGLVVPSRCPMDHWSSMRPWQVCCRWSVELY